VSKANDARVGKRVRLIYCGDVYARNPSGLEGTVAFVDDTGTLHVSWDNGSTLGLVPGVDRWEVISAKPVDIACPSCEAHGGERCSDAGVFVQDKAFRHERQKEGDE
jgi:hypothetical protein